ncbi:hypothetical protein CVT26_000231 [Gymnopilus dilepis]|uniref:Initiator tRNA phosphoribosyl transferase n=1 Tax=Gymnopilus dilepis TaxID=231916 RepID=A0A409VGA7_9AGAR|nr:hypothetical protein CVT26_000231 [Gymnopilus dilepis]
MDEEVDTLAYLRKESLDIFNRLHSIHEDVEFVNQVHATYPDAPILPNLRCGSWYVDPKIATNTPAYFKSTDGHFNNWSFNLRRSNLHLLPLIVERNGIILVDSTRAGKRIPDALSKTVPIWCAVINRALLIRHPEEIVSRTSEWNTALYTPPSTVSRQEHNQIEQRLDEWAKLLAASSFALPMMPHPLRPFWITPATSTFPTLPAGQDQSFLPVICVSASKQIIQGVERRSGGFSYIQGSGDDHELWGLGLNPELFWAHHDDLLNANRTQLPEIVSQIVAAKKLPSNPSNDALLPTPVVRIGGQLLISTISEASAMKAQGGADQIAYLFLVPIVDEAPVESCKTTLYISITPGKKGQAEFLQTILPRSMKFISKSLAAGKNVCIACESGKDLSVGVALAAMQLFFTDDGKLDDSKLEANNAEANISACTIDKHSIRTRLEWIIASRPQANPSRTTLKRVNEFLLTPLSLRNSRS